MPWLQNRIRSAHYGATLPWHALRLIFSRPKLWALSAFPFAIAVALDVLIIFRTQLWAKSALMAEFARLGWNTESFGATLAILFARLVLVIAGAILFSVIGGLVTAPFNDFLAEAAERYTTPPLAPHTGGPGFSKFRLIAIDTMKTLAATGAAIAALVISWVPVVNALAFLLAFLLMTFQYISYAQTRRGLGLGAGARFLWKHLFACAAFGAVTALLFSLPLVSLAAIPVSVVGGTLLVARATARDPFPLR